MPRMFDNVYDRFTKIGSGNFQPITRAGYKTFLGKIKSTLLQR